LRDWPVEGTVGYEFMIDVAALFVDPAGQTALDDLWHELSGDPRPFGDWAFDAKHEQAAGVFRADVERLAGELDREPPGGLEGLTRALSSLPVYRTYVDPASGRVEDADREAIDEAGISGPLARMLLLDDQVPAPFVTRFQQTTPPVMAKGVEDTAFYRYARLLSLNDVGGDPSRFGLSVAEFHAANAERLGRFPRNLLITQTHDTKRSGDVRARIGALSGMAAEWSAHVHHWFNVNGPLRDGDAPDPVEEYVIYQTLAGAWPIERERLEAYVEKALREAKRNSNWQEPDLGWEERVKSFCRALYDHGPFLADFEPFAAHVAETGERAALGQLLIKLTAPGVPDIYQGDEIVCLSLVDPDNRRPVDWERRRALLGEVNGRTALDDPDARKLRMIKRALDLRARRPEVFAGAYEPVEAGGRAIAYMRGDEEVLVAVQLFPGDKLPPIAPPSGAWQDVLQDPHVRAMGIALMERY
jgi:(1->4)-alpha-D-glucan 1-alpha-D-glucosylmutase